MCILLPFRTKIDLKLFIYILELDVIILIGDREIVVSLYDLKIRSVNSLIVAVNSLFSVRVRV